MNKVQNLAIHGGSPAVSGEDVSGDEGDIFTWPIITREDEQAVLEVLRRGAMSDLDVTRQFEREYAGWQGTTYALGFHNGTAAVQAAMFACGVGVGDEIICPSITYWASALPAFSLGATMVFADIDETTLCLDPHDIERHIGEHTKAIVPVHYLGHPCEMDAIMEIAREHDLKVIEDVSHAHGGLYRGRKVGALGDVAAASLMSRKSLPAGEAGMLTTDDRDLYERAIAWGHYERFDHTIGDEQLRACAGLPLGGIKGRMHQLSAAVGRVQLRHYDRRMAEIDRAMNYFWDLLEGVPGLRPHRVAAGSGSSMAGWYVARGHYRAEEMDGLSATHFAAAVRAEGSQCSAGSNLPLHLHPLFNTCDIYRHGRPTRLAHTRRDLRQPAGTLPISESIGARLVKIPWFKRFRPEVIERHAAAYRKVAENYCDLLADDPGNPKHLGGWNLRS